MLAVFALGYSGIIFEEALTFNKGGVGLLMATFLWVIHAMGATGGVAGEELKEALASVSEVVFFLWGAMTIVETVDAHQASRDDGGDLQGFKLITDAIRTRSTIPLFWAIGGITFCMSAVLDNLTSTIVMVSLLRKLIPDPELRKYFGATVVIAANAGGAWTPIGDVTTTMLWINGQISTLPTMRDLLLPAMVSLVVPLTLMTAFEPALRQAPELPPKDNDELLAPRGRLVFFCGLAALLGVPVFKAATGLPPYMGMLGGLGALWLLTDAIHYGEEQDRVHLRVPQALARIDTQGIIFFLGILLSISSLESSGVLTQLAEYLNTHVPGQALIATTIGLVSAVIDNVPLVAATMGMYPLQQFPQDASLWQLIAYCAGTGGSILIIGSAAGVAFMGMEKADFFWYSKKVSLVALAGYLAGIGVYLATHGIGLLA
eukprot:jgi/Chlat1/540/Chrsp103S08599